MEKSRERRPQNVSGGHAMFVHPGIRTSFVKAGGAYAAHSASQLSAPLLTKMAAQARPDFVAWSQVIPDPAVSNLARELLFEANVDPTIPTYSTVMACSSSMMGALQAASLLGHGGNHLAVVGGVETMSHVPIALTPTSAQRVIATLMQDPASVPRSLSGLTPEDFVLPRRGWTNRQSGRSMGEHMEETAQAMSIRRQDQDQRALLSHQGAVRGQDNGFYDDLILPLYDVTRDTFPRRDTSLEKLARLPAVFDRSGAGTITAGNSSPLTDGAAAVWVGDDEGFEALGVEPRVRLVDWELSAVDFRSEGMLMAPARAIPRLLARHKLRADEIDVWEIHEAFAAQVLANIQAVQDPAYRREKAGVDWDVGNVPLERVNPHGGSTAIGHPFAATGARLLSQASKELGAMPSGARSIVSVCADGGQGTVALLERV